MIQFLFPVDSPFRITTRHGDKLWYTSSHRGIDVDSDLPDPVYVRAPNNGVVKTKWHWQGGRTIELYSEGNVIHWMAHFSKFLVEHDTYVSEGDKIAVMGNSGLSRGRHLHWHAYIDGIVVDPLLYLKKGFYMDYAIIRNQRDGSFAFLKGEKKQPLSPKTIGFAQESVMMEHTKDAYKFHFNLSDEQYNQYPITWEYFPEDKEFMDKF